MQLKRGEVSGPQTPVGILPTKEELNLDGFDITPEDLDKILSIDADRWCREMGHREQHLAWFDGLPDEIWAAHYRVAAALD